MKSRQIHLDELQARITKLFDVPAQDRGTLALLETTLTVAVNLWIPLVASWSWEKRAERAAVCSQYVAEHADIILYKSKGTADAFNHLAEGLAILALQPGGVTIFNLHFERSSFPFLNEAKPAPKVGDVVGYSGTFLRNTGQYFADTGDRRGLLVAIEGEFARVRWDDDEPSVVAAQYRGDPEWVADYLKNGARLRYANLERFAK